MAENLPFGEIRPQARPINAFIQPAQFQTGGVARPALLDQPAGLTAVNRASPGNVAGFNSFEQLADSLGPFLNASATVGVSAMGAYAKNAINFAYYDELKNQSARAAHSLQMQQEQAAIDAGNTVSALQKRDPEAAYVLNESNPFKMIGRRRAVSNLAGAEIDNILESDLLMNAGELSRYAPGSSELMQRKVRLSQSVLTKYGLSGDELEAQVYFTPRLNKAWDKYTEQQGKLFSEELKNSTIATATASLGQLLIDAGQNGVTVQGQVIKMSDAAFPQVVGQLLTTELDRQLAMMGGLRRAEALKTIREQLVGTYGQVPVLGDALGMVRAGVPGSANRPVWGAAAPLEMLELQNRGNGARLQSHENKQKGIEIDLDKAWAEGPGRMLTTDPGYGAAVSQFRGFAYGRGYTDPDSYIKRKSESQQAVNSLVYAPDPFATEDFGVTLDSLPNSVFSNSDSVKGLEERAKAIASQMPSRELQQTTYSELIKKIRTRAAKAGEVTPGLQKAVDKAILQDLGDPNVKPLVDAGKGQMDSFAGLLAQGQSAIGAVGMLGSDQVTAYTIRLNNLFVRNAEAAVDAWRAKNPGATLSEVQRNVLISGAIAETRKSAEYAAAYEQLTKKKPGERGEATVGPGPKNDGKPGPTVRGVKKEAAAGLPDTTVTRYAQQPVVVGEWLYDELNRYRQGKPASPEFYKLSTRAKTSTVRMMFEQLRFYPQLDPTGGIRKILQQEVRDARQKNQVSAANYSAVVGQAPFNPLAPGSWLMSMIMPPAAAVTMPPMSPRGGRVSTIVGDKGGLAATVTAGEGGWNSVNYGTTRSAGQMKLTSMTIGQVEKLQSAGKVFAVGAYQFTPGVLSRARRDAGLSGNELMTPDVQTRLFWGLAMGGKRPRLAAYLRGEGNDLTGAHQELAMEWAGVQGPNGRGYYDGDKAGNYASVGAARVRQALIAARQQITGGR